MTPDLSRRQFIKNLGANLCGLALGVVSGLILTPYWIRSFGVAAYGLVPLTNNLVAYFGVLTVALSSSISRFVTVEVGRGDVVRANRVLNSSLWASVLLAIPILVGGAFAAGHAGSLISVPHGFETDSRLMLVLATGTFVISLVQAPFSVAQFAANRVDLSAWLAILMRAVQVVAGVALVATVYNRPGALMVGYMAGAMVSGVAAVYYWRRLMPWSRLEWSLDLAVLRDHAAFGVWSAINQLGSLLYLQIDLIVINRMLGPVAGGQFAALSQWSFLMRGLGGTMGAVFSPTIVHHYARNDVAAVVSYSRWAIRVMGLFLALPVGLVCGLGQPLLIVWLGPSYSQYSWVLLVMVLHLSVNIAVYPLFAVQSAVNRVRVPAIMTCVMGAGNAALAVVLTREWGMYGVAAAGALMMTAKNVFFTPVYAARVLNAPSTVFAREIAKVLALTVGLTAVGLAVSRYVPIATWLRLAVVGALLLLVYLAAVWSVLLSSRERAQLRDRFRSIANGRKSARTVAVVQASTLKDREQ